MHLPIDNDALARVVSARLATRNENEYRFQEECGSSDTTTFVRLVKKSDIRHTVLIGVSTSIAADDFEKQLLERRFDQNAAFLSKDNAHHLHSLCPVVLAVGQPHEDFAYPWTAYNDVEGWPLASNWHHLRPETRKTVVENIATFVRELALVNVESISAPLVDYVGSMKKDHILFPPVLAANSAYWLNDRELGRVTSHAGLVAILAENRAAMLDLQAKDAESKSLVAKQIRAVLPVATTVLSKQSENVLAHMNLLPQNIWIDPFTGKVTAVFGWEYAHYAPVWIATSPLSWLLAERRDCMLESEKMGDPWGVWRPHFHHPPEDTAKEIKQLQRFWDDALAVGDGIHRKTPGGVQGGEDDNLRRMAPKVCFVEEKEMSKAVSWAWGMAYSSAPYHSDGWVGLSLALVGTAYAYHATRGSPWHPDFTRQNSMAYAIGAVVIIVSILSFISFIPSLTHIPADNNEGTGRGPPFEKYKAVRIRNDLFGVLLCARIPWAFGYGGFTRGKGGVKEMAAVPCSPANSIAPTGVYIPDFMSRAVTMISRVPTAARWEEGTEKSNL